MADDRPAEATLGAASVQGLAAQLYGLTLDDARAARIAADLAGLRAGASGAGPAPIALEPGALFRQLLLAADPMAPAPYSSRRA